MGVILEDKVASIISRGIYEVGKEMLKKPSTLEYPEVREDLADNYRGIHKLDMKTCISCVHCCPEAPTTSTDS